jgi:endonuclease/exonuclease/phosphatase family metal-dependent hydrolase
MRAKSVDGTDSTSTCDVGIPLRVWTQNTILRPNIPFVPNTGADNAERTQMILDRINAQTFDLIALQEVFDDDQRHQLATGISHEHYNLVWGPTQESHTLGITTTEESGLGLVVKARSPSPWDVRQLYLEQGHSSQVFATDCEGDDCYAHKGFSVTRVYIGPLDYLYVVNTHLQAAYDADDQYSATRQSQLTEIMDYFSDPYYATHPVLLLGDLNIVAGETGYTERFGGVLSGWEDPLTVAFNNPALPFTNDKTRNAYAHFWEGNHLLEHVLQQIYRQSGEQACRQAAAALYLDADALCQGSIPHPTTQNRLDYILIRQGSDYQLVTESVPMEDTHRLTAMCRDEFPLQDHPSLRCYLADHFGLSATLRLVRR